MSIEIKQFPPEWRVIPDKQLVWQTGEYNKSLLTSMWWNDSEISDVDRIVSEVMKGVRTDFTKAILDIEKIVDSKHWNGGHGLEW